MPSIPTTEPATLRAGDTLAWRREDLTADYPASAGWVLAYKLVNAAGNIAITASASGDAFAVSVAAATSATYAAGVYAWVATVTLASARYTVDSGTITVLANLAAATTSDQRSPARKALDAVNLALESYGAKAYLQELQIGDRQQKFGTPGDFLAFRSRLAAEVAAEESALAVANGQSARNKLLVRFR